jgi:site-specific DNA-methyltransferase (adenine-specific)
LWKRRRTVTTWRVDCGDCLDLLKAMPDCSVDACVTDAPYGLSFMGKKWDYDVPSVEVWAECLRVLKPGGHLLAFAGTRTQHRMAVRIEDAGFEIRDMIAWVYSTGFPKSHNLKGDWKGWGTALKPAWECVTMARKPFPGTVAANVMQHGTGAVNVDGCRVGTEGGTCRDGKANKPNHAGWENMKGHGIAELNAGRWPANLIHDGSDEVLAGFPESGNGNGPRTAVRGGHKFGGDKGQNATLVGTWHGDSGSAARFFFQCKDGYNEAWQDQNLPSERAASAEPSLFQQRKLAVSALSGAATLALPEGLLCSANFPEPSTTATGSELRLLAEIVTETIQSIAPRFWHESKPTRLTLTPSHASVVDVQRQTGTTTITASRWKSDGSADPATFTITSSKSDLGVVASRFKYCPKASKADREAGLEGVTAVFAPTMGNGIGGKEHDPQTATPKTNPHPTVKPTALMQYLCRLVTPPGGTVLDPFCGSGSTGKAAMLEGFNFIGFEREAEYVEIARRRIAEAAARPMLEGIK